MQMRNVHKHLNATSSVNNTKPFACKSTHPISLDSENRSEESLMARSYALSEQNKGNKTTQPHQPNMTGTACRLQL